MRLHEKIIIDCEIHKRSSKGEGFLNFMYPTDSALLLCNLEQTHKAFDKRKRLGKCFHILYNGGW